MNSLQSVDGSNIRRSGNPPHPISSNRQCNISRSSKCPNSKYPTSKIRSSKCPSNKIRSSECASNKYVAAYCLIASVLTPKIHVKLGALFDFLKTNFQLTNF